jgi:zinc D-Ala-D-Ala carboxypeptidase
MKISEHFTLGELSFSAVAVRRGLDNTPNLATMKTLARVAAVMEEVRTLLGGRPIVVHSGYRSVDVNRVVGGVSTSAHCLGLACDFVCPAFGTPPAVALEIVRSDVEYDQLILEYGWVHLGLAPAGSTPRHEALTKRSQDAPYEVGIRIDA